MSGQLVTRAGMSVFLLLASCVAWRVANALAVITFFNPDEYWQSLEPAHRMVFGYGHLSWEWAAGLRGYSHPLVFAALYKALQVLGLDTSFSTSRGPKVLQGIFAAVGDVYVYRISKDVFGAQTAWFALACQLSSWFNFYCLVRTYSNCMESVLLLAGVYHWGLHRQVDRTNTNPLSSSRLSGQRLGLLAAAWCVVMRPPSLLFWLAAGCWRLWQSSPTHRLALVADAAAIGGAVLGVSLLIDRACYGRWVFVMWEFAKFNVLQGGSSMYGSHPWHWNFTQGFPAITASYLVFLAASLAAAPRPAAVGSSSGLLLMAWLYVCLMSIPDHKEFRFLLPSLQLVMPHCGRGLQLLFDSARERQTPKHKKGDAHPRPRTARTPQAVYGRIAGLFCLVLQALPSVYLSLVHQRGTVTVMDALADEARMAPNATSVLFLMPCHSTPYYSHVHRDIPMAFLDCSPPGWAEAVSTLNGCRAESDHSPGAPAPPLSCSPFLRQGSEFLQSPEAFVHRLLSGLPASLFPSHIAMFDGVQPKLQTALEAYGYRRAAHFFHSHVAVDHNGLQRSVVLFSTRHEGLVGQVCSAG